MPSTLHAMRQATPPTNVGWSGEVFCEILSVQQFFPEDAKSYFEIKITDGTAEPDMFKIWHGSPENLVRGSLNLEKGDFISIKALFYRDRLGLLNLNQPSFRALEEEEIKELLAGPPERRAAAHKDYEFVTKTVDEMNDPRLRLLCQTFLEQYGEPFQRAAAAREFHHAYRGGLLAHTAQMMRGALAQQSIYPERNWDLIKAGILFHDSGKMWEHDYAPDSFVMPRTKKTELLGHITSGIALADRLWTSLAEREEFKTPAQPPAEEVRDHLLHLIASHHGQLNYGSPVIPATPEAWFLHSQDLLDSHVQAYRDVYAQKPPLSPGIFKGCAPMRNNPVAPLARFSPALTK